MIVPVLLQFCALHPFIVMVLLVAVMLFLFYRLRKPNQILWSNVFWLLPVFGVFNFIYGDNWNGRYVFRYGEKGTGVVLRIQPTNTWVNRVRQVEYQCLIKTQDGQTLNVTFANNMSIFYPKPELWMPPQIGETFDIKYISGNETNFVILTNDPNSDYSNKIQCTKLLQEIASAKAAYDFDKKDSAAKEAYVKLLRKYISKPCDEEVKKAYTLMLERMENDEM